jgi:hypothetical protein
MNQWTKCSCGHLAQDHNVAWWNGLPDASQNLYGPMTGAEPGRWKQADLNAISKWGCDLCECCNCSSNRVETDVERVTRRLNELDGKHVK